MRYGEWVSDYFVWDERNGALLDTEELRTYIDRAKKASGGTGGSGGDPFGGRRRKR